MIEDLKKIELHVHLDGSVRPETVSEILNLPLDKVEREMCFKETRSDLTEYLSKFDLALSVMQTRDELIRVSRELAEDLVKDNIIYAEVRYSPHKSTLKGLTLDEVVESTLEGFNSVKEIKINVILCMMRNFDEKTNMEVIDLAERFKDKGVVAIDLAGDEAKYKTEDFSNLFKIAREKNIPFTIHAGEADGVDSIKSALSFQTKRLGHGVRILEDTNLVEFAANNNILFEVCPTSNIQTGVSNSYKEHQIKRLFEEECDVLINTDNRTVSNTNLNKEIKLIMENQDLSLDDIKTMIRRSVKYTFLSDEERKELLQNLSI